MKTGILIVMSLVFSYSANANNLPPVAYISPSPNQTWFYNLEEVVFTPNGSYDPDGYINYTRWYINGVYQKGGSYSQNMSKCFALYGSPSNGCYQLADGTTTVQVKLEVRDNSGAWSSQTKTYTIQEHKGRKYFVKDHLGTVRTTVNRDGNVLGYDDYYPFGLTMPGRSSNTGNPNDNYKFTGYEQDDEAGLDLYYANARMYDPVLGRFMQVDRFYDKYPFTSPYSYTLNNPVNFTDVTGDTVDVSHLDDDVQHWLVNQLTQLTGLDLYVENGVLLYDEESEVNTDGTSELARNDLIGGISHKDRVSVKSRGEKSMLGTSYSDPQKTIYLDLDGSLYKQQNSVGVDPLTMGLGMSFMHELNHSHIGAFGRNEKAEGLVVGRSNLYRGQIGIGRMGQRQQYSWIEDKNLGRLYHAFSPDHTKRVYVREIGGPRPYHRKKN